MASTKNKPLIIPHDQLSAEALQGLIEEFVTRDGTDYGERESTLANCVSEVMSQLDHGRSVILFDTDEGGFTIVARDALTDDS